MTELTNLTVTATSGAAFDAKSWPLAWLANAGNGGLLEVGAEGLRQADDHS